MDNSFKVTFVFLSLMFAAFVESSNSVSTLRNIDPSLRSKNRAHERQLRVQQTNLRTTQDACDSFEKEMALRDSNTKKNNQQILRVKVPLSVEGRKQQEIQETEPVAVENQKPLSGEETQPGRAQTYISPSQIWMNALARASTENTERVKRMKMERQEDIDKSMGRRAA